MSGSPPSSSSPSSLRHLLVENAAWLAVSIALAVVVWFAAVNQQNPVLQQRFRDTIPVHVLKDDTMLVVNPPSDVQVVVRAPSTVWDLLTPDDITVNADLRGKAAGTYTVTLQAALAPARQGAVSEVLPSQVTIELAKRSEQVFNITVVPTQNPTVGFFVKSAVPATPTVTVSGSEDAVKRVVAVDARVDLAAQNKPLSRTLDLVAVDANNDTVSDVELTPPQVTVAFDIEPRPGVSVVAVAPNLQKSTLPQGYLLRTYSADPSSVAVQGELASIEALNGTVATDPIDLSGKTQSFTQTVKLALPPGVTLTDPIDVTVSVQIDPINGTLEFSDIPVLTQGLDQADFAINLQPDHVSVIVNGPQTVLDTLQASDITVIAPLNGLGGGTFTVTLQASIAHAGLTSANVSLPDAQVQVTIRALQPTPTLTPSPSPPPTAIPTAAATASVTP